MPSLKDIVKEGRQVIGRGPCLRTIVAPPVWTFVTEQLAEGHWTLLDLWAETEAVHMALLDESEAEFAAVSLACAEGRFPSVAARHAPAVRLERAVGDLYGLTAEGAADNRPWLDHGHWGIRAPLGRSSEAPPAATRYDFLAAEGESLHQVAVGPVHAGIIEPGHFRFTASGETVVRLEARLGYVHKGIERLMRGAGLERAATLAGRIAGDSTVAYALAFARAVEAALAVEIPARAQWLRALLAELERTANHLGDIGAICNDASFALMHAHCGALRERVLRVAGTCFCHRLMQDCVVPGGSAVDVEADGIVALRRLTQEIGAQLPTLIELYDNTASLQDRTVGTGSLTPALARQYGAGGFVGRASGRSFDARRIPSYQPYDRVQFEVPVRSEGDVNARVWIRIREVEQSLALIEQVLAQLPEGARRVELPRAAGEGTALVEGFRGDIFAWVRLDAAGAVERCRLRDPSWFQWPLLEAAIEGNIVADFPLCNKSFNCAYSGQDL